MTPLEHAVAALAMLAFCASAPPAKEATTKLETPSVRCSRDQNEPASGARPLFSWYFAPMSRSGTPSLAFTLYADRTVEMIFPDEEDRRTVCARTVDETTLQRFRKAIISSGVCQLRVGQRGKGQHEVVVDFRPALTCGLTMQHEDWQRSRAGRRVRSAMRWLRQAACGSGCPARGWRDADVEW